MNQPQQFVTKPVVIDAVRWTGGNDAELNRFVPGLYLCWSSDHAPCISTREGMMRADVGDWIIREPFPTDDRRFYPCKPDIFEATYEPAEVSA